MRVTVLIAVYNGERHLAAAIDSVLAQTFVDFELLLVDDGSTDGTVALVESYDDPRVRLLRNAANTGQIFSLNRGLREARGEYVARLDHDDVCLADRLARQVTTLDAAPAAALAGTWIDVIDEQAGGLWTTVRGDIASFVDFVAAILVNRFPFGHPSIMFRRDLILGLGGYDESLSAAEDLDLYRRLALARHEVRVVREPLVLYRRHGEQMSQAKSEVVADADALGHERFMEALSPGVPARSLRLLLTDGAGLWGEISTARAGRRSADGLGELVAGAATRLRLSENERAKLERAVARRVAKVVQGGWRDSILGWWLGSRPIHTWAVSRLPHGERLRSAAIYRAARLLAPLLRPLYVVESHAARSLGRLPILDTVRQRARQSRTLRVIYGRLIGQR
ncbi:MAG: glycosyltransferase family 2 protein [Gaiellaceae bacterium]